MFKPLLAKEADFSLIDTWVTDTGAAAWCISPKLDGIRALVHQGVVMSRKGIPIPNAHVQALFGRPEFEHLDGELIVGEPNDPDVYTRTYSGVMKSTGAPKVHLFVFDHTERPCLDYAQRHLAARRVVFGNIADPVYMLDQHPVASEEECRKMEEFFLAGGYEGAMLRRMFGPKSQYKFGRSTAREGTLLKVKRFTDSEATIVGFEEEMANNNEAVKDALGHTKRSSHAENKAGKDRLGALVCELPNGVRFNIGTGFDAKQRESFWYHRQDLLGRLVTFKHFEIGAQEAPRFPVFKGFRDPIDL